jgi:AraC family transcriptional regulator
MLTAATIKAPRDEPPRSPAVDAVHALARDLDADLRLASLASAAGSSAFHFHRRFSEAVGETPKQHVTRLRLEKAALLLRITERRVLDIALTVGFNNHETFSRAFKRAFGHSPSAFRRQSLAQQRARVVRNRAFRGACCRLSEVRVIIRPTTHLVGIRRVGAYADFPAAERARLWGELARWADTMRLTVGPERLGLFPDDPLMTPGPRQCADVCIPVDRPTKQTGRVRGLTLTGGRYAFIEHFGPYETLIQAHRALADRIQDAAEYLLCDEPPVQSFETVREGGDPAANRTSVWMRVLPRR